MVFTIISLSNNLVENQTKKPSLIKEPSGCSTKCMNNILLLYVLLFVVVEFIAFGQPRKITAAFIKRLLHAKIFPHST